MRDVRCGWWGLLCEVLGSGKVGIVEGVRSVESQSGAESSLSGEGLLIVVKRGVAEQERGQRE